MKTVILALFRRHLLQGSWHWEVHNRTVNVGSRAVRAMATSGGAQEDPAVTRFREYLRIRSVQPNPDYKSVVIYLKRMAEDMSLEYHCIEPVENRPVVVMTLRGSEPHLPAILLNSHTDVVPVFPEYWKFEPFSAAKDSDGNIYARGSQDMKCVGSQYMEAVRRLKSSRKTLRRNVHLSFVPDEEIGGGTGMGPFINTELFKRLNIGFALDEGMANPGDAFKVYYGQRSGWWVRVDIKGNPGHASQFIRNTAAQKMKNIVTKILTLRESEEKRLESNPALTLGDVITPNVTFLQGGVQYNVVPAEMTVGFDVRIPPDVDLQAFESRIKSWCAEEGPDVSYEIIKRGDTPELTSIAADNPWWRAFKAACEEMNLKIETEVFPAGTDSKYLRRLGIPALGFSPMNNTPVLLHDHNEFLNENTFLQGIQIYQTIITHLANLSQTD